MRRKKKIKSLDDDIWVSALNFFFTFNGLRQNSRSESCRVVAPSLRRRSIKVRRPRTCSDAGASPTFSAEMYLSYLLSAD